jgi:putative toxin-antitoxin system antitoxin component (TIGR02293 family)
MLMYPLAVSKVSAALGGKRVLSALPQTVEELAHTVSKGLPRSVVPALAAEAAPDNAELRQKVAALIVSPATFKRSQRLSASAGERAERLARITALAHQAFGDADEAKGWLTRPHSLLHDRRPIETAATDLGARIVERILHNVEHGLPL